MAADDLRTTPTEVRAPRGTQRMEITWGDGHVGAYPHALLRGYCPCAHCQGHQGPVRFHEITDPLALDLIDIEEVGNYALKLTWGDAHDTGIYSFRFLRTLCACEQCGDPTERVARFGRG